MQSKVEEIQISGNTFLTIDHGRDGLRLLTHKDTEVVLTGKTLYVKDLPSLGNAGTSVTWTGSSGSFFSFNNLGSNCIVNRGNSMAIVNGKVVSGTNLTTIGGSSSSSSFTREECITEHVIQGEYARIQRVVSKGSMQTRFLVPLDDKLASVRVEGSGGVKFKVAQSFASLNAELHGSGDITLSASSVERLVLQVQGSGDVALLNEPSVGTANITLTGSGDIDLNGAAIQIANVSLTGSGHITQFIVLDTATITLTGRGDIKCKALANATIRECKTGSGKIKTTRIS